MTMTESQFYGGSAQEARDGWEAFQLREQCRKYGCTIRREKGKIIIMPNAPPNNGLHPTALPPAENEAGCENGGG